MAFLNGTEKKQEEEKNELFWPNAQYISASHLLACSPPQTILQQQGYFNR